MRTVTKEDLIRDLRALGVRDGMKLQVHSSLSRIGWVEGGADAVLDALMTVLTPEGTLMLPSFNHGEAYRDGRVYDRERTPTTNGKIPDTFWRRPDVYRGVNPTHPFAAWGKDAAWYVTHDQEAPTMGAGSPLDRLMRDGGYVLLLGVGYISNTFHHLAEFPINDFDLSMIFDTNVTLAQIKEAVDKCAKQYEILRGADFVDEYRGKGILSGKKSVTIRLSIGSMTRTLKTEEITECANAVIKRLTKTLGGVLRG